MKASSLREYLLTVGAVTADRMDAAVERQKAEGGRLDTALLEVDALDEHTLLHHFATFAELPIASRSMILEADSRAVSLIDGKTALHQRVLPLEASDDEVHCMVVGAVHPAILQILEATFNRKVTCYLACDFRFQEQLARFHDHTLSPRYADLIERFPFDAMGGPPAADEGIEPDPLETSEELDEDSEDEEDGLIAWILESKPRPDKEKEEENKAAAVDRAPIKTPSLIITSGVEGSDASMAHWMMDDDDDHDDDLMATPSTPEPEPEIQAPSRPQLITSGVAGSDASMAHWMMDDDDDDDLFAAPVTVEEPAAPVPPAHDPTIDDGAAEDGEPERKALFFGGPRLGARSQPRDSRPVSDATFASFMQDDDSEQDDAFGEAENALLGGERAPDAAAEARIQLMTSGVAGSDASMAAWMLDDSDDVASTPSASPSEHVTHHDDDLLDLLDEPGDEDSKSGLGQANILDDQPIPEPPIDSVPEAHTPSPEDEEEQLIAWILSEGQSQKEPELEEEDEDPLDLLDDIPEEPSPAWEVDTGPPDPVSPKRGSDQISLNVSIITSGVEGSDASMAHWMMDDGNDDDDSMATPSTPEPEHEIQAPSRPQLITSGVAGSDASIAAWMMDDDDDDPLAEPPPVTEERRAPTTDDSATSEAPRRRALFFGAPKLGARSQPRDTRPVSDATFASFMQDSDEPSEPEPAEDVVEAGAKPAAPTIELMTSGVAGSDASIAGWMMDDDSEPEPAPPKNFNRSPSVFGLQRGPTSKNKKKS